VELREAVADIDEETERLNRIVTEVLDFAKPVRLDLAEANVNDVCRASAEAARTAAADVEIRLDLAPDMPQLVTDAERLRTVLINLLTNARAAVVAARDVAHTARPQSGRPAVTAGEPIVVRTRVRGSLVTVEIQDGGMGITHDDMPHIFDPYFTTRRAGTGLGLPIARNIVEGLGGTIAVSSRPGEGTAIRIELPIVSTEAPS
jgi:two-component system, NtrC family, sensor histidine kinase HydH